MSELEEKDIVIITSICPKCKKTAMVVPEHKQTKFHIRELKAMKEAGYKTKNIPYLKFKKLSNIQWCDCEDEKIDWDKL